MIYILQKSKRTPREKRHLFTVTQATMFLHGLKNSDLKTNKYYLLGSDDTFEIEKIINTFSPKFIIKQQGDVFDNYLINETINQNQRYASGRAKHSAIEKFATKIEKKIEEISKFKAKVQFLFEEKEFEILVQSEEQKLKITCSYQLELREGFVYDTAKRNYIDIKKTHKIFRAVGEVFRKQRHYYKLKGGPNEKIRKAS